MYCGCLPLNRFVCAVMYAWHDRDKRQGCSGIREHVKPTAVGVEISTRIVRNTLVIKKPF